MRTITFEVDVDDKIFDTMVPSIYDDAVKEAPDGRPFLCASETLEEKKLVRVHRDVTAEGGKESPWFENYFLPDDMRIVGMTGGNDSKYVNGKLIFFEKKEPRMYKLMEELSRVDDLVTDVMRSQFENQQELLKKHEELLDHFKQVHEEHLDDCTHFAEVEERMTKRIHEGSLHAANTANTVGHDILRALPELEDRIKEYIGHPDPAQSAVSDDVTPQALLKAIEIVSGAMLRGAK